MAKMPTFCNGRHDMAVAGELGKRSLIPVGLCHWRGTEHLSAEVGVPTPLPEELLPCCRALIQFILVDGPLLAMPRPGVGHRGIALLAEEGRRLARRQRFAQ